MDTAPIMAPQAPAIPAHGKHEGTDAVDLILRKQQKEEQQKEITQDMKQMKGFVTVFTCPKCKHRLNPSVSGTAVQYGECPYCKAGVQPDQRTLYAGGNKRLTNGYAKADHEAFKQGQNLQSLQTTRKIIPFRSPLVAVNKE